MPLVSASFQQKLWRLNKACYNKKRMRLEDWKASTAKQAVQEKG